MISIQRRDFPLLLSKISANWSTVVNMDSTENRRSFFCLVSVSAGLELKLIIGHQKAHNNDTENKKFRPQKAFVGP